MRLVLLKSEMVVSKKKGYLLQSSILNGNTYNYMNGIKNVLSTFKMNGFI